MKTDSSKPGNLVDVRGTALLAGDTREQYRQKLARITLDSMVQFVGLLDAKGTVLEINQVALDAVGVKLSDVEGRPFSTTFWWQVSEEIRTTLTAAILRAAQGEFVRWDTEIYGRAGGKETIIIDASLCPVKDEHGTVVFITAEGRDITEKKAQEREIARQREELAKLDEVKTQFFANISHEFRTPLTLMLGPLEDAMVHGEEPLGPRQRERIAMVQRNGLRLQKLVNALLDFSRVEAGRIQAVYQPTDLAALTHDLVSSFRSACEKAGLTLTLDTPPLAEPVCVDREMWEKIVLNLVSNAFKFTLAGGIGVAVRAEGDEAVLRVSDTGTGIPAAEVPLIFDRFHRVAGAEGRTHEGTGIGLALVQELVKLHKGSVAVESTLGRGTVFTVRLPFGSAHLPQVRVEDSRGQVSTATRADAFVSEALRWLPDGMRAEGFDATHDEPLEPLPVAGEERARVLLADDNADLRDYLCRLLRPRYDVRAVADGEAALAALRAEPADLLLSDVMMPRLDGFGLLRAVRSDPALAGLPVVLLSARAGEEASIEGLESGADDYLVKPFSARELLARVAANLEMARLRSHRRKAEANALAVEERLRAARVASGTGTFRWDIRTSTNEADEALDYLFGFPAVGAIRSLDQFLAVVHPHDRPGLVAAIERSGSDGSDFEMEFRVVLADGRLRWLYDRGKMFLDEDGRPAYMAGACVDITERKRTEAALRELNDTLERRVEERTRALEAETAERQRVEAVLQQTQRLEAIGQLTGGVAHDFNNLLTVIIGQAESIVMAAGGNERIVRMATAAQRVAERGAQLTAQLLAFSRRQRLRPEHIVLHRLMAATRELVRRAVGEAVTVEIDADSELWPSLVDPSQFESAVLNLAVNARDAMPNGGVLTIDMRNAVVDEAQARRLDLVPGDYVLVSVSDSGCGMPPDVQERCFEPFYTTKDVGKGTGLGLSQVYGFARQSGGAATVVSAVGRGTTIALYLPRTEAAPAEISAPRETIAVSGRGKTVLVVEDQEDVRDIVEALLCQLNYRVLVAPDGLEARKILGSSEAIDLLLTDVVMPNGLSGLELARWARRARPDLKIVLVSGYSRQMLSQGGGDDEFGFLEKPFRPAELAATIATALRGAREPNAVL